MSEVGGRFVVDLLRAARSHGVDADALCRSLDVRETELGGHDAFVSWSACADLLEGVEELAGGPEGLRNIGRSMMDLGSPLSGGRVLRHAIGPSQIYPLICRWAGPSAFPVVESRFERLDRGSFLLEIEIPEPHRACAAFFNGCLGSMEAAPRMLGLADSVIEAEIEPRRCRFVITPPPSLSVFARLRRLLDRLRSSDQTIEELRGQHEAIQRQRAEIDLARGELEESELRFTEVFQLSPVPMVIEALDGGSLLAANDAFLAQTGVTREEALATDMASLLQWRSVEQAAEVRAMIRSKRSVRGADLDFRDGRGRDRHGLVWSQVSKFGGVPAILFQLFDVTERREAELALEQSEARLRATIAAVPDGIGLLSADGTCLDANLAEWLSEERGVPNPAGLNLSELGLGPELESTLRELMDRVLERQQLELLEFVLPLGGVERRLEARVAPCGPDRVVCIVRDMTERHELEERLRQSQKMEAIGQLAGGVAHDFNNLLTAIGGYADLQRDELEPGSQARKASDEILASTQRAGRLTQQLLTFGRRQIVRRQRVELNSVVRGIQELLQRLLGEHIAIRMELCEDATTVSVDTGQLEQMLMNLALNARDAMPGGGELRFSTREASAEEFEAAGGPEATGSYVCLRVADDGAGMDERTRLRVFEPFFTTKPPGSGTGLGLATVFGVVTRFGGAIRLDSSPGDGTTVEVFLPRDVGEAEAAPHRERRRSSRQGGTVLFVEDEPPLRELARSRLSSAGYTVLLAGDGAEALEVNARHSGEIDALVTDVVMPRMGGLELASELSLLRPGIKILFVSGYPDQQIPSESRLLSKPFRFEDLERTLGEVLDD